MTSRGTIYGRLKWHMLLAVFAMLSAGAVIVACGTDPPPDITPPMPRFAPATIAPDPVDGRIYADVDPSVNALWIEWLPDSTHNTSGYELYRSSDSLVGDDGLLKNGREIFIDETTNEVQSPLSTIYRDTTDMVVGGTYYYQLRAFYRSPTGSVTHSKPTQPGLSTSFQLEEPVVPVSPQGTVTVPDVGLTFVWHDDSWRNGGDFQVILYRRDTKEYVWSTLVTNFGSVSQITYPLSSPKLEAGVPYQWRVKRVDRARPGGNSSYWVAFQVQ